MTDSYKPADPLDRQQINAITEKEVRASIANAKIGRDAVLSATSLLPMLSDKVLEAASFYIALHDDQTILSDDESIQRKSAEITNWVMGVFSDLIILRAALAGAVDLQPIDGGYNLQLASRERLDAALAQLDGKDGDRLYSLVKSLQQKEDSNVGA